MPSQTTLTLTMKIELEGKLTLSAGLRRSGALSMRLSEFDSVIVAPLDQNLNLEVLGSALFLRKHFVHFN